jgi:hypothetical protein
MTDTLLALDEAIQKHIAELSQGESIATDWILVTHAQQLDVSDPISGYRIITSDTQPIHTDLGLLRVGNIIAQASWDAALDDTED